MQFVLTPTQQGMLFHHWRAGRASGVDIEQIVVRLDEPVDAERLRAAWQATVDRHGALRTRFDATGLDDPVQCVDDAVALPFTVEDWRGVSADERFARWTTRLDDDRREGFDLAQAPLTRVLLVQTGDARWQLVWTVHHIACDGRSFPVVLSEVFARYDGRFANGAVRPAPDFAAHVHRVTALAQEGAPHAEAFWRERLAGLAAPPLPGRADAVATGRGHEETHLTTAVTQALHRIAEANDLTLATIVLGAWAILLSRLTGEDDVIFGATRSGRRASVDDVDALVGCLINTLPVRTGVDGQARIVDGLRELRRRERDVRAHEFTALMHVQAWSGVMARQSQRGLFDSVVVYDHASLDAQMRQAPGAAAGGAHGTSHVNDVQARSSSDAHPPSSRDAHASSTGGAHATRRFDLIERTHYPLALYAWGETPLALRLAYDEPRFSPAWAKRWLGALVKILEGIAADPSAAIDSLAILSPDDEAALAACNDTRAPLPTATGIAREFEAQVRRTPNAAAVVHRDTTLSYDALNRRANRLAYHLLGLGVGPDVPVAVLLSRSADLVVAILAVLKAGGCYLPLDPSYPRERLAYKLQDAGARVMITACEHAALLDARHGDVVRIDNETTFATRPDHDPATAGDASRLAYLIYTSGSTGRPKGVMVEQRQVLAFFAAMDEKLPRETTPGTQDTWLAVTSLAFDISVLELLWTLTRGFKVVVHDENFGVHAGTTPRANDDKPIAFSLMYFASAASAGRDPYRLLIEGATFADTHGFQAVWTPERHFHDFGGLYPNPSLTSAMLAAVTTRVQLRAGSVVAALHHPARIAEEWAVADNLSGGRVGISFASGWQPRDFVLAPQAFETARASMLDAIDQVKKLWRGEAVSMPGPKGQSFDVRTLPRPKQAELPIWITAAGAPQTFADAGMLGAGVLTHLLGQSLDEVAQKITAYRDAWRAAGHPGEGHVTMMLHSFVGDNTDAVRETVRKPMVEYLGSSLGLVKGFAAAWSAFKKGADGSAAAADVDIESLSDDERQGLLGYAFERYFETSGLFGDEERALDMTDRLKGIGVDEIACLIDFGVDEDTTLAHLRNLARVHRRAQPLRSDDADVADAIVRHGVTHLQCTPSLASALALDDRFIAGVPRLRAMLLGGEALPLSLAARLLDAGLPKLINMYGPTETTIWSATHEVTREDTQGDVMPIGLPIANTRLHVVDRNGRLVAPGVAGELCIGGAGVVRGYHARPELTAERFVVEPWAPRADGTDGAAGARVADAAQAPRMYRTGDLVRRRDDGAIEFLGRIDHQVKIRGHRIELGEIEAALGALPNVREAVVVAREDEPGDKRLVAYVIAADATQAIDAQALRHALRERLPEAMVPGHIIALERFPQTPNRKIDRKALPAPEVVMAAAIAQSASAAATAQQALAAATAQSAAAAGSMQWGVDGAHATMLPTLPAPPAASAIEARVATIWQEVLNLPAVGLDQNFFDLGGHSLLAVKAHRRLLIDVPEAKGAGLGITDLFRYPTVRALALRLDGSHGAPPPSLPASQDRGAQRRSALAARRTAAR